MDYSKTKIYKIWSPQGDKIYIGSTTKDYLSQRMTAHRNNYKSWKNNPALNKITSYDLFDEYGIANCFIELLIAKECTSKDEQTKLEGHYIRSMECVNKHIPDRTRKEYYQDNKAHFNARSKKWHEENREAHNEYKDIYKIMYNDINKEYINEKFTCGCTGKYTRYHKRSHERSKKHLDYLNKEKIIVDV